MKNIILTLSLLISLTASLQSQNVWTEIIYHYQTGSIPPPYYFSYDLSINSSGTGIITYYPDYRKDTFWVYNITVPENEMINLNENLKQSNVLTDIIPSLPDTLKPIGGSLQNLTVILYQDPDLDQVPPRMITPYFPQLKYKEMLGKLYEFIKSLVSQPIWEELKQRKEEYINKKK